MPLFPRIAAVATAVPAHPLDQEAVVAGVAPLFEPIADFARLRPVFANSGVRRRIAAVPIRGRISASSYPIRMCDMS